MVRTALQILQIPSLITFLINIIKIQWIIFPLTLKQAPTSPSHPLKLFKKNLKKIFSQSDKRKWKPPATNDNSIIISKEKLHILRFFSVEIIHCLLLKSCVCKVLWTKRSLFPMANIVQSFYVKIHWKEKKVKKNYH